MEDNNIDFESLKPIKIQFLLDMVNEYLNNNDTRHHHYQKKIDENFIINKLKLYKSILYYLNHILIYVKKYIIIFWNCIFSNRYFFYFS